MQKISRRAKEKRRYADKLAKVWQRDGQVEIRADYEKDFPERMFVYYYRLFDRYRLPWVSLVGYSKSFDRFRCVGWISVAQSTFHDLPLMVDFASLIHPTDQTATCQNLCNSPLVVLADDQPQWRPDHYARELWGCKLELCFPVVKLLDFQERLAEPEADPNPFTGFRGFRPDTRSYWQCRTRMRPRNRTVLRCASSRRASQPEYFAWTLCPGVRDAS